MRKRKGIAEDMKNILFSEELTEKEKNKVDTLFKIIKLYYKIYDLDHNTNHSKIFEFLYLSKKYLSDMAIAQRSFISVDTLRKYIGKYNRLIRLLIIMLNVKL